MVTRQTVQSICLFCTSAKKIYESSNYVFINASSTKHRKRKLVGFLGNFFDKKEKKVISMSKIPQDKWKECWPSLTAI